MIAITSIAPSHPNGDIQQVCVNSWHELGMKVYSMNSHEECELLRDTYKNVTFIPTHRTLEQTFGKPYVSVNAVLDWCKDQNEENFCIINSDIELRTTSEMIGRIALKMVDGILMLNRINHSENRERKFTDGIDVFFINKRFLKIFPQSIYCLGQCHWDYWIPYTCSQMGVECSYLTSKIAYHRDHKAQYNHDMWLKTGRFFLWENNLYQFHGTQEIPKMSAFVFSYINNYCKQISI